MVTVTKTKPTQTIQGTTGQQFMTEAAVREPLMKTLGDAGVKASQALAEADQRLQRRQNLLYRTSDEKTFTRSVAAEWQRVQDNENLTDEETVRKFNNFVQTQKTNVLSKHRGRGDSLTLLNAKLMDFSGRYEGAAITATRTATIDSLTTNYTEITSPLIAKVSSGEMTETQAIAELNRETLGPNSVGEALPQKNALELADIAQSQIIIAGLERDLNKGTRAGVQAARLKLEQNPSFATMMTPLQLKSVIKRMSDQEYALNASDVQYGQKRERFAIDSGFSKYNKMPAALKSFFASGGKILPPKPYEMQSPEGKQSSDRAFLVAKTNENSPSVKAFDALVSNKSKIEASSKVGKLLQDRKNLTASGSLTTSPEVKAIDAEINNENPEWVASQERVAKFAPAVNAFEQFNTQALGMHNDAKRALMLLTNESTYEKALKAAQDNDFNWTLSGVSAYVSEMRGGSDINEINAILTRIGGKAMIDALASLKAASPTGASGMGALNKTEGDALRFQAGALDVKAPQTTAQTLIGLINATDSVITSQAEAFKAAFPTLGAELEFQLVPKNETNTTITPKLDLNGKPVDG